MKAKVTYICVALLILISANLLLGKVQGEATSKTKKFEYKLVTSNETLLNQLGAEGWELHSVISNGSDVTCYMKRSN